MSGLDYPINEISLAVPRDLPALQRLLDKSNKYSIQVSGLPGWKNVEYAYKDIEEHLQAGDVFVIRGNNGSISSTITLSESTDEWEERGQDGKALYFTKFMKDPDQARPDEALKLLKFAAEEAARRGRFLLRCDTVTDQPGIISYYKNLGFMEQGHFMYESSGREGILLEANVSHLSVDNSADSAEN
jgi:hypothetical protein